MFLGQRWGVKFSFIFKQTSACNTFGEHSSEIAFRYWRIRLQSNEVWDRWNLVVGKVTRWPHWPGGDLVCVWEENC